MPSRLPAVRALAIAALSALALAGCYTEDDTTAPGAPLLTLETAAIDLGVRDAATGVTPSRVLTLRNGGDASTGTVTVRFADGSTSGLVASTGTTGSCGGHALAAGGSCTITVSLGGQGSGPQTGLLTVDAAGYEPVFAIPVQGAIRSALTIAYQGVGHGTVTATPTAAVHGCIGATNCSATAQGAVCTGVCGLAIDARQIVLTAVPDGNSTFDGFVRAAGDTPCVPATGATCLLTLADLNSVTVRFTPK